MPYIEAQIGKKLTPQQIEQLKSSIGKAIELIPTKSERGLMVNIKDDLEIYFHGQKTECVYTDVRIFGTTSFEAKAAFIKQMCIIYNDVAKIASENCYLNFHEHKNWGVGENYVGPA
jgi:hypothetical protein